MHIYRIYKYWWTYLQGRDGDTAIDIRLEDMVREGEGETNWKSSIETYIQFRSVAQSCPTLCDPMNCSTPGLPVHHQLPEFTQTHVHRIGDAIHPSHPLLPHVKKIASGNLLYNIRELKPGALWQPAGMGCGWKWEGDLQRRVHMYTYGWIKLMYSRNQYNIVKQLSSN